MGFEIPPDGVTLGEDGVTRCWWCGDDPLYVAYHDTEWGRPLIDDGKIFEKLCLEGFMSGLSWLIILRKRENFRAAFEGFDLETVAGYGASKVEELLGNSGIVRNRAKIEATINNAARCIELIADEGSLAGYFWSYEPVREPSRLDWPGLLDLGVAPEATAMSKDLKRRGWRFVGPTTVYSVMESAGLVNDHMSACDITDPVDAERRVLARPTRGEQP
jgi:DNA-3-methyladenine glycosylase I